MSWSEQGTVAKAVPFSQVSSGHYQIATPGQYHGRYVVVRGNVMIVQADSSDEGIEAVKAGLEYYPVQSVTITRND